MDNGTKKAAVFTPARWASFLLCLGEIDNQLCRLSQGEDVAYCTHYGGGWHVSLTKGFRCVDLRKFYVPGDDLQAHQDRHRATPERMANVQDGRRQYASRQPDRHQLHAMLPQPGPRDSAGHRSLRRVQSVMFSHFVTVYTADDHDRKSPWMRMARERLQFRCRIKQTELILAPILSEEHRLAIRMSRCDI